MTIDLSRRSLMHLAAAQGLIGAIGLAPLKAALAQGKDSLTIAFHGDVPAWDPNLRTHVVGHSIFKCVFDQPLSQAPDLSLIPSLITAWKYIGTDGLKLELTFRDDAYFHNGDKFTAEDFKYTFDERPKGPVKLDVGGIWRRIKVIDVVSPTVAVINFTEPMPAALPWFTFLASFIVPKKYMESVGVEQFMKAPVGTGPYKLVDYTQNSRIVLEAFDKYWGGVAPIKRVTFEIVRDVSARSAAIEARRVDLAVNLPVREVTRLGAVSGLTARVEPYTDIMILQVAKTGAFEDERVRLAAHHAINKEAISKALFGGIAKPIDVAAAHGTPGYPEDYVFGFSEAKATALLKEAGFSPANPVKLKFFTTNGVFPSDFDIARVIEQMWRKVGIQADLETIEFVKYQEFLRAGKLPEATIYSWGNATGDPELYAGNLLNPKTQFSAWKTEDMDERIAPLMKETDNDKRMKGYRETNIYASSKGYTIPLLQAVSTVVYQNNLKFVYYQNGLIQPNTYKFG